MGKSVRNTAQSDTELADQVAKSLGISPKGDQQPEPAAPKPTKQKPADISDQVGQSLGLKKKDGGGDSSNGSAPTQSVSKEDAALAFQNKTLTPGAVSTLAETDEGKKMGLATMSDPEKDIFAAAHNGPKKADVAGAVTGIIDANYPASNDPKQNDARFKIKQSVLSGDQKAIADLRNSVVDNIQKKINLKRDAIAAEAERSGPGAWQFAGTIADNDPEIKQLQEQQRKVQETINDYGKLSLVDSKDMQAWLKLDSEHPEMLTSEAADKLGKAVEDRYGIQKTSANKEYDRMRTGFDLITKSLQMDINEALSYGLPIKNKELIQKAQDKLATLARYRNLYDKLDTEQFPDVGLDKTARFLGDIIAEKHPNKLIRTKEDVREAGQIADERNPGFMNKYGKFVDVAAEKQNEGTFIPRGGGVINEALGGLISSSTQVAVDLMKWKPTVLALTDPMHAVQYEAGKDQNNKDLDEIANRSGNRGTTQSGTIPTKIVYDKEGKAYREMPNENYGTMPWNNFFRFAGESVPGLIEFIAAESASGGVAGVAMGGKISTAAKGLIGLTGATYLTSYNANREFADANIDDKSSMGEAKKIVAANFLTMANAGVFHLLGASPSKMVESAISKAVMPDVVEMFEKNSWEKLTKETADGFLREHILPRAKAIVDKFGESAGSGVKMGAASVIDQKLKDFVGAITNKDYSPSTIEDNGRAFVQQALLMTAVGLPGMISSGLMPHTTREALHQAGLYAPQYIDEINDKVNRGEIDPHKAAGMISMVKTMAEELKKASVQTNDDGTPLTTRQQRDIAIAEFRKRGAEAMEDNNMDPGSVKGADDDIKDIKKQNNWQSIEETPTFKSIKEVSPVDKDELKKQKEAAMAAWSAVDGDGPEADKIREKHLAESEAIDEKLKATDTRPVASMTDIDPTKQYTYEKEGEMVTTDGASLIHHLETGDIYEREKTSGDKDQVAETEKTKDAEGKTQKPAENQEKEAIDAKAVVAEAVKDGKIADNLIPHVEADPEEFLKGVADQALGYTRSEGERVKSDLPAAEQAVRDQYGDKVVDAALKMFPEEVRGPEAAKEAPPKEKAPSSKYEFVDPAEAKKFDTPDAYLQHLEKEGVIKIECD